MCQVLILTGYQALYQQKLEYYNQLSSVRPPIQNNSEISINFQLNNWWSAKTNTIMLCNGGKTRKMMMLFLQDNVEKKKGIFHFRGYLNSGARAHVILISRRVSISVYQSWRFLSEVERAQKESVRMEV